LDIFTPHCLSGSEPAVTAGGAANIGIVVGREVSVLAARQMIAAREGVADGKIHVAGQLLLDGHFRLGSAWDA
jgi:hypothetical protein